MRDKRYDRRVLNMVKRFDSYNILIGDIPIIFSAPHNTEHTRNNKSKAGEVNTRAYSCKNVKKYRYSCYI